MQFYKQNKYYRPYHTPSECTLAASRAAPWSVTISVCLAVHPIKVRKKDGTDRWTNRRQTITFGLLLDVASVIKTELTTLNPAEC